MSPDLTIVSSVATASFTFTPRCSINDLAFDLLVANSRAIKTLMMFNSIPSPTLPEGKGATQKEINSIKIKNKIYKVEIRNTEEGRRRGLSNTKHNYLCDDCALLFVWESEGERTMWMKDMNYPIDMYWLNKNMQIVHSEYNVATSTYIKNNERSSQLFGKGIYNAQYVLETRVD